MFLYHLSLSGNSWEKSSDKQFAVNWQKAKEKGIIRGAYHYYRPNENSELQRKIYQSVNLEKGASTCRGFRRTQRGAKHDFFEKRIKKLVRHNRKRIWS
jgi:hypothetical protein